MRRVEPDPDESRRKLWRAENSLRFFADRAAKKWPLRGSLKLGVRCLASAPRFAYILRNALERLRICSNDPVCADHEPDDRSGDRATHTFTATYSPDDNKIRLYASSRLDSETYARVKAAGFRWAPKQDLFFTTWSPRAEGRPFEDHLLPRPRQEGFRQRARRGEGYGGPDGTQAALRLMRKLLKKQGFAPKLLVTDKLRSYRAAFRHLRLTCPPE
jgi:hypothetical protein